MSAARVLAVWLATAALMPGLAWGRPEPQRPTGFYGPPQAVRYVAIAYQGGVERLVLSVDFARQEGQSTPLLILPLPANRKDVQVQLTPEFPRFSGRDLRPVARADLRLLCYFARYPLGWPLVVHGPARIDGSQPGPELRAPAGRRALHTETVAADSPRALAQHLTEQGLHAEPEDLAVLAPYMEDGWVLVLASADAGPGAEAADAYGRQFLFVRFPTKRAVYPLKPLSARARQPIELRGWVLGHVRPNAARAALRHARWAHFQMDTPAAAGSAAGPFWKGVRGSPLDYTAFAFRGTAGMLTRGMTFVPAKEPGFGYATLVHGVANEVPNVLPILFVALLLSYVSAGLAGLAMFHEWHRYAALGLWNMLTVVVFGAASAIRLRDRKGPSGSRWFGFVVVFAATFIFMSYLFELVLMMPFL